MMAVAEQPLSLHLSAAPFRIYRLLYYKIDGQQQQLWDDAQKLVSLSR